MNDLQIIHSAVIARYNNGGDSSSENNIVKLYPLPWCGSDEQVPNCWPYRCAFFTGLSKQQLASFTGFAENQIDKMFSLSFMPNLLLDTKEGKEYWSITGIDASDTNNICISWEKDNTTRTITINQYKDEFEEYYYISGLCDGD